MPASSLRSETLLLVFLAVVFAVSSTTVVASVLHIERTALIVDGLEDGAILTAAAVRNIAVGAADSSVLDRVEVLVDNIPVATRRDGDRLSLNGFDPAEGTHTFVARVSSTIPLVMDAAVQHNFTVDNTAPPLTVDRILAEGPRSRVTIRGTTGGAEVVRVGQSRARIVDDVFEATVPPAPATVFVEARDAAGNATGRHVAVPVPRPEMRVVRLSVTDWTSPQSRESVLDMARQDEIDAVELDVKDETGQVAHRSKVPLAKQTYFSTTSDHTPLWTFLVRSGRPCVPLGPASGPAQGTVWRTCRPRWISSCRPHDDGSRP
jgi:hypothetical protein